jgi:hypothetical protein
MAWPLWFSVILPSFLPTSDKAGKFRRLDDRHLKNDEAVELWAGFSSLRAGSCKRA